MNGGKLHSALRELQDFASSRNFWIVLAAIVLLFTAIGPFGTGQHLGVLPRFGFWLVSIFVSTGIAIVFVILAELYLDGLIAAPFPPYVSGLARLLPRHRPVDDVHRLFLARPGTVLAGLSGKHRTSPPDLRGFHADFLGLDAA